MTDLRLVSWEEHGNKRWFKPTDFRFAANDRVVAVGYSEIPKAMMSLPLGFAKTEQSYQPVIVQGLLDGQNLLVTPKGQWVADYIPVLYRSLPFRLAKSPDGKLVVCADHDLGLITDTSAGYQFFANEKKLAPEANDAALQLMQFEEDRTNVQVICKMLDELAVLEDWELQVQHGNDIQKVAGLYRVNETRLREIPMEALAALRANGGLMLCYAQLFSMQHMQQLGKVSQRSHWASKVADNSSKGTALNIVDDNGILSFANL